MKFVSRELLNKPYFQRVTQFESHKVSIFPLVYQQEVSGAIIAFSVA